MLVNVSFTLDVKPEEWAEHGAEVARLVQTHAENVVRDLFWDQGWTVQR